MDSGSWDRKYFSKKT